MAVGKDSVETAGRTMGQYLALPARTLRTRELIVFEVIGDDARGLFAALSAQLQPRAYPTIELLRETV